MIFDTNLQESKELAIVNMKDHYNVEVLDSKHIKELMDEIQEKLTKGILDNMMQAKSPKLVKKSTKLRQKINHKRAMDFLKEKLKQIVYDEKHRYDHIDIDPEMEKVI